MEMYVPGRRHYDPSRLERPPFASDDPHPGVIQALAEHSASEGNFAWGEWARVVHRNRLNTLAGGIGPR